MEIPPIIPSEGEDRNACDTTGQLRYFTYDLLGQLTSAQLPEYNGAIMTYAYDDQGNVTARRATSSTMP